MSTNPTPDAIADGQVEIWKKIVDVQQHFNDLELRIRNFALAVSGAFLGLGGYAIKDGGFTTLLGLDVSVAGIVVFAAIFPLAAFYFMDRLWYHRLLEGSVAAGINAEAALKNLGLDCDLGSEIKTASPFQLWFVGWKVRSKHKMDLFYLILLISLLIVAGVLGFGLSHQENSVAQVASAKRAQLAAPRPSTSSIPAPQNAVVPQNTAANSLANGARNYPRGCAQPQGPPSRRYRRPAAFPCASLKIAEDWPRIGTAAFALRWEPPAFASSRSR